MTMVTTPVKISLFCSRFEANGSVVISIPDGSASEHPPLGQYCVAYVERRVDNQAVKKPIFDFCIQDNEVSDSQLALRHHNGSLINNQVLPKNI